MSTIQLGHCWPLILDPSSKAVLISLADQASDDGECYPAIGSIAQRTCLSERTVQAAIARLVEAGLLRVIVQGSRRRTNAYTITAETAADHPRSVPLAKQRAAERAAARQAKTTAEPRSSCTPQQLHPAAAAPMETLADPAAAAPEPSLNTNTNTPQTPLTSRGAEEPDGQDLAKPSSGKRRARSVARPGCLTLADWLALCRAEQVKPIPKDDPVWSYAQQVGLSDELISLAWQAFKRRRLLTGKAQRDWRATFRNAVEGNWHRLWFLPADGPAQLTTVGQQLSRELAAAAQARVAEANADAQPEVTPA